MPLHLISNLARSAGQTVMLHDASTPIPLQLTYLSPVIVPASDVEVSYGCFSGSGQAAGETGSISKELADQAGAAVAIDHFTTLVLDSWSTLDLIPERIVPTDRRKHAAHVCYPSPPRKQMRVLPITSQPRMSDLLRRTTRILHSSTAMTPSPAPLGWSDKADDLKAASKLLNASRSFPLPGPYEPLLVHNNGMDYLIQCGSSGATHTSEMCLVIWNDVSGDVMRIEFPTTLEDLWTALPFWGTVEAERRGPRWTRMPETDFEYEVEAPADPTDWHAGTTLVE